MPGRLATEVGNRARNARRVSALGLRGLSDPLLIDKLAEHDPDCVLVTGNYWMPAEHEGAVARATIAIAAIDPRRPVGYTQHAWRCDVVHRWIHVIQKQAPSSVRRYALARTGRWSPSIRNY